ncbi:MAG: NAD-dependent epimerase/dehydratase family protein [Planctomycetota bacterium]|nr:NAD-dependent epimerase/dehydratase family protein [Planctomycetota bacterium]
MKILVTGGAGFIGSHICDLLTANGHEVRVLDNLSTGSRDNLTISESTGRMESIEGDILNKEDCARAADGTTFVCHLAALISVVESQRNPGRYIDVNVKGTSNVLEAAREAKVKRFVLSSSAAVYGEHEGTCTESTQAYPVNVYGLSKLMAEDVCSHFSSRHGLETISLRYFNVFGPRQNVDSPYSAVIPAFNKLMINGERPVIYGDGEQSRDFVYVRSVALANMLALQAKGCYLGSVFNVGTGEPLSINNLFELLAAINDFHQPPINRPARGCEVRRSLASIEKAKTELGYKPYGTRPENLAITAEHNRRLVQV